MIIGFPALMTSGSTSTSLQSNAGFAATCWVP